MDPTDDQQEDVLGDLFRVRAVSEDSLDPPADACAVGLDERVHRFRIATTKSSDQARVSIRKRLVGAGEHRHGM
jgi:hypothetical protein